MNERRPNFLPKHVLVVAAITITGCAHLPLFPDLPVRETSSSLGFDMDEDGRDDYWQDVDAEGRKVALHFDDNGDGRPDSVVRLDEPMPPGGLHAILILDGVPFSVVQELYQEGRFRLFGPPSRVVSVFPALTDLAFAQAFGAGPCLGYEAEFFDVEAGAMAGGQSAYLNAENEPWLESVDYRASTSWDVTAYLNPGAAWRHDLSMFRKHLEAAKSGRVAMYSVATAGLITRGGRAAVVDLLQTVEAFCERITYERRGNVRLSVFADHGHGLTPCKTVDYRKPLEAAGFKVTKKLKGPKDVVMPRFGLVTDLAVHTRSPEPIADVLVEQEGVDLVVLLQQRPEGRRIMVRNREGSAAISKTAKGYAYEPLTGDPLQLEPVLERLESGGKLTPGGIASDEDWFAATYDHVYPDPLHRIWTAFEPGELVVNPADLIVSLREGYAVGSGFFSAMVNIASTHGALSRMSSTTFLLSNQINPPPALRIDRIHELLDGSPRR